MTIRRYSAEQLKKLKGKTRWDEVYKQTDKDIEKQAMADPDSALPTEKELKQFKPIKKKERR